MNLGPGNVAPEIPGEGTAQAVITHHNDTWRTGSNSGEYQLTPATVGNIAGAKVFGRLGTIALDEQVDAQPLVVPNVSVKGDPHAGTHDVVYLATENNTVYAIDPVHLTILAQRNLGAAVPTPLGCGNNSVTVGINGTPVIDKARGVIYVMAYVETSTAGPQYQLHALSLATLADVVAPVTVAASASLNNGGTFAFNATYQRQRPALLESGGLVLAAFGSFCDFPGQNARGWLLGFNAATLALDAAGVDLVDKLAGSSSQILYLSSVWMSGSGPASDESGNVYFSTGNSDAGTYDGVNSIQESVVKMSPATGQLLGVFTPGDLAYLDEEDLDLGSSGVVLLPNAGKPVGAILAKDGLLRVFDRTVPGGNNDAALQTATPAGGCWCAPSYFNDGQDRLVSAGGTQAQLYTWQTGSAPGLLLQGIGEMPSTSQDPGAFTAVSAGGTGNAILWTVPHPFAFGSSALNLMAFQAAPVNGTLPLLYVVPAGSWLYGGANANIVPTVANGRVYVASYKELVIFGLGGTR
jgi:hydrogenase/urease accessory protein HupE